MKKLQITLLCISFTLLSYGQNERKFSFYSALYGNWPVYDAFYPDNGNGAGINIDFYLNTKSIIKPKLEVNMNVFQSGKLFVMDENGASNPDKNGLTCFLIGPSSNFSNNLEVSLAAGPCLIRTGTYLGLKPAVIYYLGKRKILKTELSFTNIFQPDAPQHKPFGFISFGLGLKIH